jgi:hypothetical protein
MVPQPVRSSNLDPQKFLLQDKETEKKLGITLAQTVLNARANKSQLFKDYQIYISSLVKGHQALLHIVEKNGGDARLVSNTIGVRAKVLRSDYLKSVENQVLIGVGSKDEKMLRDKFRQEVTEGGLVGGLFTSEWVMISVLRQEISKGDAHAISV